MKYHVIGLMSGSSLDGLDIAYCRFTRDNDDWNFTILAEACVEYPNQWITKLRSAPQLSGLSLHELDASYAELISGMVKDFIEQENITKVDLVALHGHTVFHYPDKMVSLQIGNGGIISAKLNLPVVTDLRSSDVALGGQGTPMVAISDLLLFKEYQVLINIGGIANMTVKGESIVSFDVCVANQVLNLLAKEKGLDYDHDGGMASKGKINVDLMEQLNQIEFFQKRLPRSLDNSFTNLSLMPILNSFDISTEDKLATFCEHIVFQIEQQLKKFKIDSDSKILISGGGALNKHLIGKFSYQVSVGDQMLIEFKEAVATAFSGLLRFLGEVNFLAQSSGADRNSCNGAIHNA
ncbi:MAG: anhydro-N-acetylmuramic acid kinase [Chitinophagales bacterium]|nr:anhydro-N-acetylmuramic acid kinase [Chitinophagales bacterium]